MLDLIIYKLKDYRQSIPMILVMTGLTLVLIYVFGRGFEGAGTPVVAVVDHDQSNISRSYLEQIGSLDSYQYEIMDEQEAIDKVKKGNVVGAVVMNDGFGAGLLQGSTDITLIIGGTSIEQQMLEQQLMAAGSLFAMDEQFVQLFSDEMTASGLEMDDNSVRTMLREQIEIYPIMQTSYVSYDGGSSSGYDSMKHSFIGFILFFSTFTMIFGVGSMVEEKENKVWDRLMVSPVSKFKLFLANMISAYLVGITQLFTMVILSKVLFKLDWGGSLLALFIILSGYVLAVISMGFVLSNMVTTMQQLGAFSPVLLVSTSMIGGCMWPLEIITSKVLLFLADLTPQRWAYLGMSRIILENGQVADIIMPLIRLVIIAVVLLAVSLLPFNRISLPPKKKVIVEG